VIRVSARQSCKTAADTLRADATVSEDLGHVSRVGAAYAVLNQRGASIVADDVHNLTFGMPEERILDFEVARREQAE
jgi:hypothetical protein